MEFQLKQARLRPWLPSDVEALVKHANNRKIWRNLTDGFPHPYTLADARAYVGTATRSETTFAIEVVGEAAGSIGLEVQTDVYSRGALIGYWLSEAYWGRGIMTAAVQVVTAYGFSHLNLARISAAIYAWNLPSMRVLEKAGYHLEGRRHKAVTKDGQTIDDVMYAIVRPE